MPRTGKKYHCPDVLSNLVDDVIDAILTCLPLQDAVRSSILSKKWSEENPQRIQTVKKESLKQLNSLEPTGLS
ncbi:hypothetical protein RND71_020755 [Anisodus tanguticus]|uniref:F-box domain-containing protein n=1 Tax=Anisodus tanguticus TaxID=243964 RepID=A0AAE1VC86_9SOLA|nr:hypothetical protein RND71_020755 [Anisodus tanguticus]